MKIKDLLGRIPWEKVFLGAILVTSAILGYWSASRVADTRDRIRLTAETEQPPLKILEVDKNWDAWTHWTSSNESDLNI